MKSQLRYKIVVSSITLHDPTKGLFTWARFPRSRLTSIFCKIFDVCMRGRPSCRPAVSVPEISVSGLEILPYQHFRPVNRMNVIAGCILAFRMASLRHRYSIACCIFHIISIPFNCRDTVLRDAEAMIGAKVKIFVISPSLLSFSNLAPELVSTIFGLSLISETGLK